jgi:hypothetical protein
VPGPAGVDRTDDWQDDNPTLPYRALFGLLRGIDGFHVDQESVQATALQLVNGGVDLRGLSSRSAGANYDRDHRRIGAVAAEASGVAKAVDSRPGTGNLRKHVLQSPFPPFFMPARRFGYIATSW